MCKLTVAGGEGSSPRQTEVGFVKQALLFLGLGALIGAGLARADDAPSSVPFRTGKKQAVVLPVQVSDSLKAEFLLDTGLGFNVISPELAAKLGLQTDSKLKVKPITGGEFEFSSARLPALKLGSTSESNLEVVVAEPRRFIENGGEVGVDGILSLAFFREHPFTLDYPNQALILEESDSLEQRKKAGERVECRLEDDRLALVALKLKDKDPDPPRPGGFAGLLSGITGGGGAPEPPTAWVQVATGSENLMLDSKLMFTLKIDATGANITETEETDQNGVRSRRFASHMARVGLATDNSVLSQEKQAVVFRKLRAEGALGQNFLRQYVVTFNLPGSELIFGKR